MEQDHHAELAARLQLVVARAHRPLTEEELEMVRTRIERDLEHRDQMRTTPLNNGDAPDPPFSPRAARPW